MKKYIALCFILVSVLSAYAGFGYVSYDPDTDTYMPEDVNTEIKAGGTNVQNWAHYPAGTNINANNKNLMNVSTGWFKAIFLNGVPLGPTGGPAPAIVDAPISGIEVDGQSPTSIVYRTIPSRYSSAFFWYPFDYASSVVLDSSGNGLHAVNRPSAVPMSWSSYALRSTSTNQNYLVQINSNSVLNGSVNASMGAWLFLTREITNNNVLLSSGGAANINRVWFDATNIYSTFSGYGYESTLTYPYGASLNTQVWHRIVATYAKAGIPGSYGASHRLWLDGALVASDANAISFFISSSNRYMVFNTDGAPGANMFIDGRVDDVFVSPILWDAVTITTDYAEGRSLSAGEFAGKAPAAVSLRSPVTTHPETSNLLLEWSESGSATNYTLCVYTNWVAGSSPLRRINAGTTNRAYIGPASVVAPGTNNTIYWYVIASNSVGASTSSTFSCVLWNPSAYSAFPLYSHFSATNAIYDYNGLYGYDHLVGNLANLSDFSYLVTPENPLRTTLTNVNYFPADICVAFWYRPRYAASSLITPFMFSSSGKASVPSMIYTYSGGSGGLARINTLDPTRTNEVTMAAVMPGFVTPVDSTQWRHFVLRISYVGGFNVLVSVWDNAHQIYFKSDSAVATPFNLSAFTSPITFGYDQELAAAVGALLGLGYTETAGLTFDIDDLAVIMGPVGGFEVNAMYRCGRTSFDPSYQR